MNKITIDIRDNPKPSVFQKRFVDAETEISGKPSSIVFQLNDSNEQSRDMIRTFIDKAACLLLKRLDFGDDCNLTEPTEVMDSLAPYRYTSFAPLSDDGSALFALNSDPSSAEMILKHVARFDYTGFDIDELTRDSLAEFVNGILGNLIDATGLTRHGIACPITVGFSGSAMTVEGGKWLVKTISLAHGDYQIAVAVKGI